MPTLTRIPIGLAGDRGPKPSGPSDLPVLLGLLVLGGAVTAVAFSRPLVALGVPFVAGAAWLFARHPVPAVLAAFFLTGTQNTVSALTPLPAVPAAEFFLATLWIGAIFGLLLGKRDTPRWIWPGVIGPILYIVLTILTVFVAEKPGLAIESFRLSTYYMAAMLLIAFAPWPRDSLRRIANGIVAISAVIGLYCVFRYIVGPSGNEEAFARATSADLPTSTSLRFYGSFITANQLAAWAAVVIPFGLALALGRTGLWRAVALGAAALAAFAVFASDVRTGIVAAGGSSALVILLYACARSFPTTRIAHAFGAGLVALALGVVAYSLTIANDPESTRRFENIVNPTNDFAYAVRQNTWTSALEALEDRPFGYGVGTSGSIGQSKQENGPAGLVYNVDSSYLKVALEQGLLVMVFWIVGLLILLAALAWRAITVTDRERAVFAIGGCGALAAMLFLFYAGTYHENISALAGWIIVGLGVAQFTVPPAVPRPEADRRERPAPVPGPVVAPAPEPSR